MVVPTQKDTHFFSSAKFDEHNNEFDKSWPPGYELMLGTTISTLPTLKIDHSYYSFIKYDIFEGNVNFLRRGNPIGSTTQ